MSFDQDPSFATSPIELQLLAEAEDDALSLPTTPRGPASLSAAPMPMPLTPVRPRNMPHCANLIRTMQVTPTKKKLECEGADAVLVHPDRFCGLLAHFSPKRERQPSCTIPLTPRRCTSRDCSSSYSSKLDLGLLLGSKRLTRLAPCPPPPSRYEETFLELENIGGGSFGVVYRVVSQLDGQTSAIKQVSSKRPMAHRLREVEALQRCAGHPGIMRLHDFWTEGNTLFLQFDYFEGGSVIQRFPLGSAHWTEAALTSLLCQTAEALVAVHDEGLAHLDVKAENIYCQALPTGGEQFVLGDFGIACDVKACQEEDAMHQSDCEGDSRYLCQHLLNSHAYLIEADIFSLGASIYELARAAPLPTSGEEWHLIRSGALPGLSAFSPSFQQLLQSMMAPNPWDRPSASEIVRRCSCDQHR